MKANERALLSACIDTGIYAGWIKAHKYNPEPHELRIQEEIDTAIWYEIDQYFVFDSERDLCDEVVEGFDELEKEREWVGLTEYEIQTIEGNTRVDDFWATKRTWNKRFAQAIQDTLKRKNT